MKQLLSEFNKKAKRYKKIVIWGERSLTGDSFRYIMNHFYTTLSKLAVPSIWIDDTKENYQHVARGDLVISANVTGTNLPVKRGVYYCLHNFKEERYQEADKEKTLILQVYTNDADKGTKKWDAVTRFDRKNRTLYQPWGTNLLPWEFKEPIYSQKSPFVFWIGTVYSKDDKQGNYTVIQELKQVLRKNNLHFINLRVPDPVHVQFIRRSRIAPAVAGQWQAQVNYLPCRVFKNISFGQLGITNVPRFKDLLGSAFISGGSVTELMEKALTFSETNYKSLVLAQQEIIRTQTYLHKLLNIFTGLEEIS